MGASTPSEYILTSSSSESDSETELYDFSQKWERKSFPNVEVSVHRISHLPTLGSYKTTKCAIVSPLPRAPTVESLKRTEREDSIEKIVATLSKQFEVKKKKSKHKKKWRKLLAKRQAKERLNKSLDSCNIVKPQNLKDVISSSPYAGNEEKRKKLGLRHLVKPVTPVQQSNKTTESCKRTFDSSSESDKDSDKPIKYTLRNRTKNMKIGQTEELLSSASSTNSEDDIDCRSKSDSETELYDFSQKWKRKSFPNVEVSVHRISHLSTPGSYKTTKCAIVSPLPRAPTVESPKRTEREDSIEKIVATLSKQFEVKKKKSKHKKKKCKLLAKRLAKEKLNKSLDSCDVVKPQNLKDVISSSPYAGNEEKRKKLGLRRLVKPVTPVQQSNKTTESRKRTFDSSSESDKDSDKPIKYTLRNRTKNMKIDQTEELLSSASSTDSEDDIDCRSKQSESEDEIKSDVEERKHLCKEVLTNKKANLQKVKRHELALDDVCLSCGTTDNVKAIHPLFVGGLCEEHHTMFQEWYFQKDKDGCQSYCAICCNGRHVVLCDKPGCRRCYCSNCLNFMVGPKQYKKAAALKKWFCHFCCDKTDLGDSLLKTRPNWKENLQHLLASTEETTTGSKYPIAPIPTLISPSKRKPIRVLSLFDGIATGLVALKGLGLEIGKFVASEIDEDAIRLVQNRHREVVHVGDVTKLTDADVKRLGPFDLVMGGSPCNDLSGANPRRKGLLDPEGSGCLFFDFFRVLRAAQPHPKPPGCRCDVTEEGSRPFFWLFENVVSMKLVERHRISRFLQCEPISINAQHVSAAARPRLFWGNIPGLHKLRLNPSPGDRLTIQDCLEPGRVAVVDKLKTITTKPSCLYAGSNRQPAVKHAGKDDTLWSTEVERIFGVPEHYTDVNNLGPRERLALLGRSWSVPVIRQILAPLTEYFKHK